MKHMSLLFVGFFASLFFASFVDARPCHVSLVLKNRTTKLIKVVSVEYEVKKPRKRWLKVKQKLSRSYLVPGRKPKASRLKLKHPLGPLGWLLPPSSLSRYQESRYTRFRVRVKVGKAKRSAPSSRYHGRYHGRYWKFSSSKRFYGKVFSCKVSRLGPPRKVKASVYISK